MRKQLLTANRSRGSIIPSQQKTVAGFESPEIKADDRRSAVFFRPLHGTSYGRAVREGFGPAGSLTRSLNPYGSAHPFESGEAENTTRSQGVMP